MLLHGLPTMAKKVSNNQISNPSGILPPGYQPPNAKIGSGGRGSDPGGLVVTQLDRTVTYYKLTQDEIINLRTFGVIATFFFSGAGTALGFWLSIQLSSAFSNPPLSATALWFKDWIGPTTGYIAIILAILGVVSTWFSWRRLNAIKGQHIPRTTQTKI